jgi:hypothetical protein
MIAPDSRLLTSDRLQIQKNVKLLPVHRVVYLGSLNPFLFFRLARMHNTGRKFA